MMNVSEGKIFNFFKKIFHVFILGDIFHDHLELEFTFEFRLCVEEKQEDLNTRNDRIGIYFRTNDRKD